MIKFRVKLLTKTAKNPTQENSGDLWDLYVDDFSGDYLQDMQIGTISTDEYVLNPNDRILIKTGIALQLPIYDKSISKWNFNDVKKENIDKYAVADIRPRSGLALKHGINIVNSPGTIDNKYRKEIGIIIFNCGKQPYKISKGDKIAQMLIRSLEPSSMENVTDFIDTGRGGFGSTGK